VQQPAQWAALLMLLARPARCPAVPVADPAAGLGDLAFSARYFSGETGQALFTRRGLAAGGATLVVASQDWLTLLAGWLLTSPALQSLLTFFPQRPQARIAARREAVASRLAELCLLLAAGLISWAVASLPLPISPSHWHRQCRTGTPAGALLLVCCVVLKTAQLPFHGWLTQVMEAPTPVSALLHAGVVNLGGMVLIKLSALGSRPASAGCWCCGAA
jgi:NAD(P)H-quinone oxidoreductase subunit 5